MISSTIQKEKECYYCGKQFDLEYHHVIHGYSSKNKAKSEKYGLMMWLCQEHHYELHHGKNGLNLDKHCKRVAQAVFEETHSRDEFMAEFGENFL